MVYFWRIFYCINVKISLMNIQTCVQKGIKKLQGNCDNPRLEAEVILARMLGRDRAWLRTHGKDKVSCFSRCIFGWAIGKRARGIPMAYILGEVEWNDLQLKVNHHTLIPRDETEILVQKIASVLKPGDKVLDLGTGSGCIGVYLGKSCPDIELTLSDLSLPALRVARLNLAKYRVKAEVIRSDLLQKFKSGTHYQHIVANLPYVPEDIMVTREVGKEPASAIFSGPDGLDHYRALLQSLRAQNITFKHLWIEFLPDQKPGIAELFSHFKVDFMTDIAGDVYFALIMTA